MRVGDGELHAKQTPAMTMQHGDIAWRNGDIARRNAMQA